MQVISKLIPVGDTPCCFSSATTLSGPDSSPNLTALAPQTIRDAISFYKSIGKRPIHVKKEIPGHAVNRIQAALYREVVHLIDQGVLDVADSDDAVSWVPGSGGASWDRIWCGTSAAVEAASDIS